MRAGGRHPSIGKRKMQPAPFTEVFILTQESAPARHGAMTAGSNVDLEPESEEEEVLPAEGKDGEAAGVEPPAEPAEQGEGEPAATGEPAPDELMPELLPAPERERPVELGDSFLDGPNGHSRAELTIGALTVDAPVPLLVEADALDVTQEPMEIEYDDEVLQLGLGLSFCPRL